MWKQLRSLSDTEIVRNISHLHKRDFARWFRKGSWAVADQGLFAVSNFALNVLMARWLTPQDYGAFSVAFTIFLLIGMFHTVVLTEPMLVFGPGRYKGRLSEYLGVLLYGHLGFAALSSLLLLLTGLGFSLSGSSVISAVLLALALTGPFILLLWLMRRACYALLEPRLAAWGGALYMALMIAVAYILYQLEWLSAASAFGVMGFSSLVVSLWLIIHLRATPPPLRGNKLARDALEDHWRYGRWSAATGALMWVPNLYFLLLPIWGGLEATASLKALGNLILPVMQANTALGILLLPALVQARGRARFDALVCLTLVPFILGPVLYWLLLGVLHRPLVIWLYGGQYAEHADLLWILGLLPVGLGIAAVFGAALRALERPDKIFWAYAFSAGWILTLGMVVLFTWGIAGAAVSLLANSVATAAIMGYFFTTLRKSGKGGAKHR